MFGRVNVKGESPYLHKNFEWCGGLLNYFSISDSRESISHSFQDERNVCKSALILNYYSD